MHKQLWLSGLCLVLGIAMVTPDEHLQKLQRYLEKRVQEKLYVQTDKPFYSPGEIIWYKLYALDATSHIPATLSQLVYIELYDSLENILGQHTLKIVDGGAAGEFKLPEDISPGTLQLRAYSNYQRNFNADFMFTTPINILDNSGSFSTDIAEGKTTLPTSAHADQTQPLTGLNLEFFPEGGQLIQDLSSVVAIRSQTNDGFRLSLEGKIYDHQNNFVAVFKTNQQGLGLTHFKPLAGKKYQAKVTAGNTNYQFDLPDTKPKGFTLRANYRQQNIEIKVESTMPNGAKDAFIIGHIRGLPVVKIDVPAQGGKGFKANINTLGFPAGILQLTLFNGAGQPECERLCFIPQSTLEVNVQLQNDQVGLRQKVSGSFALSDTSGAPIYANLNLRVIDGNIFDMVPVKSLMSYMLVESDLPTLTEKVNQLIISGKSLDQAHMDMIMLTYGWRRFTWKDVLGNVSSRMNYYPESGFTVSGQITKFWDNQKPQPAKVMLSSINAGYAFYSQVTNEDGKFIFTGIDIPDSTAMFVQAGKVKLVEKEKGSRKKNGEENPFEITTNRSVNIILDQPTRPELIFQRPSPDLFSNPDLLNKYRNESIRMRIVRQSYDTMFIEADEIVISARRRYRDILKESGLVNYSQPSQRLILDSIPGATFASTIFDILQSRVPGLRVIRTSYGAAPQVFFGSSTSLAGTGREPVFMLDGAYVDKEIINTVPTSNVYAIDILTHSSAGFLGMQGSNGAIAIYTRSATGMYSENGEESTGIINFNHPGYHQAREFAAPVYDKPKPEDYVPDFRTTLYWNPVIITDQNPSEFSFYTCDKSGTYLIFIEGVTADGRFVQAVKLFKVNAR